MDLSTPSLETLDASVPRSTRTRSRHVRRFALLVAAAVVFALFVVVPAAYAGYGDFIISGRGYGQGEGMSQWGMWQGAREHNTYQQILAFYYPGTALGNLSTVAPTRQNIWVRLTTSVDEFNSVQLTAMVTPATLYDSSTGAVIKKLAKDESVTLVRNATTATVQISGAGAPTYSYVDLKPDAPEGRVKVAPSVLWSAGSRQYWGYIRVLPSPSTTKVTVQNYVAIDKYVAGVSEIAPDWAVPTSSTYAPEAVKAQDVAARSYIAKHTGSIPYDDSRDMTYVGYNAEARYPYLSQAAQETAGQVVTYEGKLVETHFSSSSGGFTTNSAWSTQLPYEPAQFDRWSLLAPTSNPGYAWTAVVSPATMAAKLAAYVNVGTIKQVDVAERDVADPASHARTMKLTGSTGTATMKATTFKALLGLRSTLILSVVKDGSLNRYQQSDTNLAYTGSWIVQSSIPASGGSYRRADSNGSSCIAVFNGAYIAWFAKKNPHYGLARVYLDGADKGLVDLYNRSDAYVKVWDSGELAFGTHTLRIEWTGQKNALADDANISVDAFDVGGNLAPAPQPASVQQNDTRLSHSGTWSQQSATAAFGGSFEYANSSTASCSISFNGTYIAWLAKKSPAYGKARIALDGVSQGIVDLYSRTTVYTSVWAKNVSPGTHTLTIYWTGQHNTAASASNISVDGFQILGTVLKAPAAVRYQQDYSALKYAGTWAVFTTPGASGGSYKRANTSGASVTISFDGTYLGWIATRGVTLGKAWVSLDGARAVSVNLAWTEVKYQQLVWKTGMLNPGTHTVKIWWDTGNIAGKFISVDAVDLIGTFN